MPPDPPRLAARTNGRTEFRRGPVPLGLVLPPLRSLDGHDVSVSATVTLTLPDTPADHELFADAFLVGRDAASPDDVRQKLLPALTASLGEFVARHDARTCLRQQAAIETLLVRRCDAVGYGCGLTFGPAATLAVTSDTWQLARARADADARRLADLERVAATAERLRAVGEAYRLPASEQATLLPTLLATTTGPAAVLVTAGADLLRVDAGGATVCWSGGDLGGLRCVSRLPDGAPGRYAVGGQRGVTVLRDDFSVVTTFVAQTAGSARGFNAVAWSAGALVATHGDLGVVTWSADRPDAPHAVATAEPPRALLAVHDRVLLACGGTVFALDDSGLHPLDAQADVVVALLDAGDAVAVVRRDGTIALLDAGTLQVRGRSHTAAPAAATAVRVGGLRALLTADDAGVTCLTTAGEPLGRCDVRPGGVRMLTLARGLLVAVSADRARVSAWEWTSPRERAWDVNVLARGGHHVTDIFPLD